MIDNLNINIQAGSGGNGCVSFRRERFAPKGGPNGGDGGRGGSVVARATGAVTTLDHLRRSGPWKALHGGHGQGTDKHGKTAPDLTLDVPVGTVIYREDDSVLGEVVAEGEQVVMAGGGRGGRGNRHFATSVHKTPRFAEEGERGEGGRFRLEVRMLADVGIVGLPNVGKSSLLAAVSHARPRIGAFAFSTVEPELGVVEHGYERLVWMDIPGLLEGASEGVGMGERFLQHIMRTRVLVHVVTIDSDDPAADIAVVEREIGLYSDELPRRPRIFAVNKMDLPGATKKQAKIRRALAGFGKKVFFISAASGLGLEALREAVYELVHERPAVPPVVIPAEEAEDGEEEFVFRPLETKTNHIVRREEGVFVLEGRYLPRVVVAPHTSEHVYQYLLRERIRRTRWKRALEQAGVKIGDKVRVGADEIEW